MVACLIISKVNCTLNLMLAYLIATTLCDFSLKASSLDFVSIAFTLVFRDRSLRLMNDTWITRLRVLMMSVFMLSNTAINNRRGKLTLLRSFAPAALPNATYLSALTANDVGGAVVLSRIFECVTTLLVC